LLNSQLVPIDLNDAGGRGTFDIGTSVGQNGVSLVTVTGSFNSQPTGSLHSYGPGFIQLRLSYTNNLNVAKYGPIHVFHTAPGGHQRFTFTDALNLYGGNTPIYVQWGSDSAYAGEVMIDNNDDWTLNITN
jgi:hypothetical protein